MRNQRERRGDKYIYPYGLFEVVDSQIPYPVDKLRKIDVSKLKKMHDIVIKYGKTQDKGVRDEGNLVYLVSEIQRMVEKQTDLVVIAAVAMEKMTKNHPFWDGNHRTAWELGRFILLLSGHRLEVTLKEAVEFMRKIDSKNIPKEKIIEWINNRLVATRGP